MGSGLGLFYYLDADSWNVGDEDVSNSLQDMTLDTGKFTDNAFILHDVFPFTENMFY